MSERQYVTVRQAAERLSLNVETVRRWIREGKIAASLVTVGQPGYRIDVSEVEKMARRMEPCGV